MNSRKYIIFSEPLYVNAIKLKPVLAQAQNFLGETEAEKGEFNGLKKNRQSYGGLGLKERADKLSEFTARVEKIITYEISAADFIAQLISY